MEIIIDGIVYVPKQEDAKVKVELVVLEEHYKFEIHPKELGEMTWEEAKKACKQLGKGWRLPTRVELLLMYKNKNIVGGFASDYYWSSTEIDLYDAGIQNFNYGLQNHSNKYYSYYVRAVKTI